MQTLFRKTIIFALVTALGLAALPFVSASAAGEYDPPEPSRQISNERLERIWARQLRIYERMGRADEFLARLQNLIDRAEGNGKDVSALQAALDAFEDALKDAKPIYEGAKGIVSSHQGFDESGKVTDSEKAHETVRAMREKFQEMKDALDGTRRKLQEALKTFREANPRP